MIARVAAYAFEYLSGNGGWLTATLLGQVAFSVRWQLNARLAYVQRSPSSLQTVGVCAIFSSIDFDESRVIFGANKLEREKIYCEKGYISQPIPTATSRKARNAHRVYFARSVISRLERNAKVSETTSAKNKRAPK